jgi:putative membrane protein
MPHQKKTDSRNIWLASFLIGIIIFTFLVWWMYFKPNASINQSWVYFLPFLNCSLNGLTTTLLILGYRAIKKGKKEKHKKLMVTAGICSALFLISYLTYHHYVGDTKFLGQGLVRLVYFALLISHIICSIVQVPCILATFYFAFTGRIDAHKKAAKLTFPVWLYVSVTGVMIFLFLNIYS